MENFIDLKALDAAIEKTRQLKKLLTDTPELLEYLRLSKQVDKDCLLLPADRLIRTGEAAKVLCVSKGTVYHFARNKILPAYLTPGSNHLKFWLSDVKKLARRSQVTEGSNQ